MMREDAVSGGPWISGQRPGAAGQLFEQRPEHVVGAGAVQLLLAGVAAGDADADRTRGVGRSDVVRSVANALLAQIAAEEAADVILVGARARRRLRRGFESRLANRLETATQVPVVIAPPRTWRSAVAKHGGRR